MLGKHWAMTHPYGDNRFYRTLLWGLQRFWWGYDETMPDNATAWTLEFMQKACEERLNNQWTYPARYDSAEEWHEELRKGMELGRKAALAYWNNWEGLGYEIADVWEESRERDKIIREATYWWHERLANDDFND